MTGDRTSTEHAVGIGAADEPKNTPAVAIDRLRADLRTRNLYREDEFFVLKVREDDLRSLITAYDSQAERLREVERVLAIAKEAMTWAEAHVGGHTKYETAQQVLNCLEKHEDALAAVEAALATENGE